MQSGYVIRTSIDNFSPQQFQITARFSDDLLLASPNSSSLSKIDFLSASPFSNEINNATPYASDLFDLPDHVKLSSELSVNQQLPTTTRSVNINHGKEDLRNHSPTPSLTSKYFQKNTELKYTEYAANTFPFFPATGNRILAPGETTPITQLDSIDGLIALLSNLKNEQKIFSFYQGWEELHYQLVTCNYFPGCMTTGNATYAAGVQYYGSATISSITEVSEVPVPAAMWLMGSGLIGLAGLKKRKGLR
jgi:hypothetical protein